MCNTATTIKKLEISLFHAAIRNSSDKLEKLLASDFKEFMASGDIYHKKDALLRLPNERPLQVKAGDFDVKLLTDESALITYRSIYWRGSSPKSYSLRSSIWRKNNGIWQIVFHQGTLCSAFKLAKANNETSI